MALVTGAATTTLALLAAPPSANAQAVADQTLSDVDVKQVGDCTTLTINFNIRVQILSYFPSQPGKELHIRLRPLSVADASNLREAARPPSSVPSLTAITYEGDNPGGPMLTLLFSEDTRFEVEGGPSPDQVVVRLFRNASSTVCAATPDRPTATAPGQDQSPAFAADSVPPGQYVVNAISNPGPIGALSPQQLRAVAGKVVYDSLAERGGVEWHRLRVGFFETKAEADAFARQIEGYFPAAWALGVSPDERAQGIATRIPTPAVSQPPVVQGGAEPGASPPPAVVATAEQSAQVDSLIAEAESAIQQGENDRAIQLLTNARALPEAANTARAVELLGLTRERKGQTAQAQAEYEDYLARYGQTDGAERVRQRLAALSAPTGTPQTLREASAGGATSDWAWGTRGSFSQFYFRDESRTTFVDASRPDLDPDVDKSVNLNQLLTAADLTVTGGNDRNQFQARAAGSYVANFRAGEQDVEAITALYLGFSDTVLGIDSRIGRQTRNSGGVFGRFDGAWLGVKLGEKLRVNGVTGFPVLTSRQTNVLTERQFYGLSVDFGAKRDPFQATVYALEEDATGGFVSRRAIGIEARYVKGRFNTFGLLDYDVKYSEVNLALATFNFTLPDTSSISLTADYRKTPLLNTYTALIGRIDPLTLLPFDDLTGLLPYYTQEQIYQLATDRTQAAKSLTATYARPLNDKLQVNFDLTVTSTSALPLIPAQGPLDELAAVERTGTEYYWGTQLIGTGLLWENDTYIATARFSDTKRSNAFTLDLTARVPLTNKVRVSPRIRYGQRRDMLPDQRFTQLQPSVRVNYYPFRRGEVELEAGLNIASLRSTTAGVETTTDETGLLLTAGYRIDF